MFPHVQDPELSCSETTAIYCKAINQRAKLDPWGLRLIPKVNTVYKSSCMRGLLLLCHQVNQRQTHIHMAAAVSWQPEDGLGEEVLLVPPSSIMGTAPCLPTLKVPSVREGKVNVPEPGPAHGRRQWKHSAATAAQQAFHLSQGIKGCCLLIFEV